MIGRPDLGRIAPGALADLVWLGDDLTARATWLGGRLAYGQVTGISAGLVEGAAEPAADRVRP